MICGMKGQIEGREYADRIKRELKIGMPVNECTGDIISDTHTGWDRHFLFKTDKEKTLIRGSLHQFYFGKLSYGNFNYDYNRDAIALMSERYHFAPAALNLINLEIGVNFTPPIPTNELLKCLRCFDNDMLSESKKGKKRMFSGKILERDNYEVKYYNKAQLMKLYHLNIMRFEYKSRRMRDINKLGIYTLQDLTDKEKFARLGELLLTQSWKVLLFDTCIDIDTITKPSERELLRKGNNPYFWTELINKRSSRKYLKDKYLQLVREKSHRDILTDLLDAIEYKISLLNHS